ncbi:unnamed protein product, partial [Prorocentrum cordatum]
ELKKLLTGRFRFGKWQVGEAEYAGRRIRQQSDGRILVDQEKYILEQVRPMRLDKERVKCPEELLDARELRDYRGLVAKILWAARQSRPDVSGSASMLSAECPQVKIASALMANKVARHLRCTASSCLTIWPLDLSAVTMVTCSGAGGPGSAKRDGAQGGWLVMLGDSRIKGQWLWLVFRDALYGDVRGPEWWNSGTSCPFAVALVDECAIAEASEGVAVVDAKSLFDTLSKNCGGAKADRRNAIEMAIVRDSMTAEGTVVRWVPHCKMPADALTKVDPGRGNFALTDLMHKGMLALTDESGSLDERSLNLSLKSRSGVQTEYTSAHFQQLLETAVASGELYATYNRKGFHGSARHAKFYAAGVVLAFEHLHERRIVYRDLKPENLLLNELGRLKLTDMGLAKFAIGKTYTTCGTPDYFAPELIASSGHTNALDWWTLGILIFEMMSGHPPFESAYPMQIYSKVIKGINKVPMPQKCQGSVAELIKALLKNDPSERLPMLAGGIKNVKNHSWFENFDWEAMENCSLEPPYKPVVKSKKDLANFSARKEDMPTQLHYTDDGSGWDKGFATA